MGDGWTGLMDEQIMGGLWMDEIWMEYSWMDEQIMDDYGWIMDG